MHKAMAQPFTEDMFSIEKLRGYKKSILQLPNEIDEDTEQWVEWSQNPMYQVSNQGRIKRKEYVTSHNRVWSERILTNTETSDHYLKVGVRVDGQQKDMRVHQIVAQAWIPNPNGYTEVNHINGNKLDNRVENLEWCDRKKNQQHAVKEHLQPINVTTYKGKLSKCQRDDIIKKYNDGGVSCRELAKQYGVSHTTICSILNNKYNYGEGYFNEYQTFQNLLIELNELRDEWLITKDKDTWYQIVQLIPQSYNYRRTWTANYQTLRNIYFARRNHKLDEWKEFCKIIETLPYGKELICYE